MRFVRGEPEDALDALATAIAEHCLQVAAELDKEDPASAQRFRTAMMPIDRFLAERTAAGDPQVETDAPDPAPHPSNDAH